MDYGEMIRILNEIAMRGEPRPLKPPPGLPDTPQLPQIERLNVQPPTYAKKTGQMTNIPFNARVGMPFEGGTAFIEGSREGKRAPFDFSLIGGYRRPF